MSLRFADSYTSVARVTNCAELQQEVVRFAKQLGFETVTAMGVIDVAHDKTQFAWVDNTPEEYRAQYSDLEGGKRDPIMQHCKHAATPIAWNQETYVVAGQGPKWELQAAYGYRTGIAVAAHLPRGLHFFIGADRDQALPADADVVSRLAVDMQLFIAHAQDVALKVLFDLSEDEREAPCLTPRELEALRWTMEAKTAWEVGRILSISEQTAVRHLDNAACKLDCINKHHAVVKALRLGLVR